MEKKHRFSVDFHPGAMADIELLAEKTGKTKGQVIRDSIALERWFHEIVEEGGRILLERQDGSLREVIPR